MADSVAIPHSDQAEGPVPPIRTGDVAVPVFARKGRNTRIDRISRAHGFRGAATFHPVKRFGGTLAYTRWETHRAAKAAIDSGDIVTFRAQPIEARSVRLKAAPDDHHGSLVLDAQNMVVLLAAMAVDPARHEDLIATLQHSTDAFLPDFAAVRAVAFHSSRDRSLVVEMLHVTSALALALTQLKPRLRQHREQACRGDRAV